MSRQTDPKPNTDQPPDRLTFEQALAELEAIVHQLEEGDLGLADSLARYEQGVGHLKRCYHLLKQAEQRIELLTGVDDSGSAVTEPFQDESLTLEEQAGTRRRKRAGSRDRDDGNAERG